MEELAVFIVVILFYAVFGAICAAIAHVKGRSKVGWFFLGLFFQIIPIIIVACLPNLREEEARIQRDIEEKRRLREQLRQEQMKGETYRQYTMDRLDTHDDHLGIDTRETQTALMSGGGASQYLNVGDSQDQPPPPPPRDEREQWFYSTKGEQLGPVTLKEMQQLYAAGEIKNESLVWTESLDEWTPAKHVTALHDTTV